MQLSNSVADSLRQAIAICLLERGNTTDGLGQAEADGERMSSLTSGSATVRSCI